MDSNRLLQAGDDNYSYDAAGSPSQIGNRTLTYNEDNRLTAIQEVGNTVASYDYNALGQRGIKHTPDRDNYFVYDLDGRLIGEYDEQGNSIREYIYVEGEPLAMLRPDGDQVDIFYFLTDHRGAAQSLFAHEGNVGSGVRYMPFGRVYAQWQRFESDPNDNNTQPNGNPPDQRLRYPGQYEDVETGLYYNYFRTYDPDTGRYLTSDPIGLFGGINGYGYAWQNPLIFLDPWGLAPVLRCHNPLGAMPEINIRPLAHSFTCVGSQYRGFYPATPGGNPLLGRGELRDDSNRLDDKNCKTVAEDDTCYENCIIERWQRSSERPPWYSLGGTFFPNCHSFDDSLHFGCRLACFFK